MLPEMKCSLQILLDAFGFHFCLLAAASHVFRLSPFAGNLKKEMPSFLPPLLVHPIAEQEVTMMCCALQCCLLPAENVSARMLLLLLLLCSAHCSAATLLPTNMAEKWNQLIG